MSDLIQHAFHGQAVRVITDEHGEPWFVLNDLCAVLGVGNSRMVAQRVDPDAVSQADVTDALGRKQSTTVVSEPGMYEVVIRSDSPAAVPFRRWVTTEVLPSIRKTGQYGVVARLTKSDLAHMVIESEAAREAAEARVLELTPRAEAFDAFLSTEGDYSVNEAAKILSRDHAILTGERRLRDWMLANRWCYRDATGKPRAYQAQLETGRLAEKAQWHYHPQTGDKVADPPQVRVTAKGIGDLARLLVNREAS